MWNKPCQLVPNPKDYNNPINPIKSSYDSYIGITNNINIDWDVNIKLDPDKYIESPNNNPAINNAINTNTS